uniref:Uncharacterized protein n=1 Tax=Peronospora matthiolae TaxID=2874970 RepID=A0AAV1UUC3_9STRA
MCDALLFVTHRSTNDMLPLERAASSTSRKAVTAAFWASKKERKTMDTGYANL